MKKLYIFLLFLSLLSVLTSCDSDDEPEQSVAEYVKGEWVETRITDQVYDGTGKLVTDAESDGYNTYTIDETTLKMSSIQEPWVYTVSQNKGISVINARQANFALEYTIEITNQAEMVWLRRANRQGPNGETDYYSLYRIYLKRK